MDIAKGPDAPAVTEAEWEQRKAFAGFGEDEQATLRELHWFAESYADAVIDELFQRWLRSDDLRRFFPHDADVARVKGLQKAYFLSLTEGDYGASYLARRLQIGRAHRRIGLSPHWYLAAYSVYVDLILPKILGAFEYDRVRQANAVKALMKIIALDQELALVAYWGHGGS